MAVRAGVLWVGILCLLAILASAQYPSSPSSPGSYPSPGSPDGNEGEGDAVPPRNVTCKDTDGKRPGCTSTCPDRCPQQCIVLCPDCKTFCHDEVRPTKPVPPPAMFVFGDGALDVGNNAYLPKTETEEGYPPQVSKSSSGRFSNGANLADTVAISLGFQQSPPAYMSLKGGLNMWGANYASAGAGIKISTNGERSISLPKQLEKFKVTRTQMEDKLGGDAKMRELLSKSVFLISIGGQDLDPRWNVESGYPRAQTELQELTALYGEIITSLYDMGARKLAIVNVGLIGCMPPPYRYECDQSLNDNATSFDAALKPLMAGLASKMSGLSYSIGDFYGFTTAVFANPSNYGLVNTRDSCSQWGYPDWTYCYNPDAYWFWDPEFMTDRAAKLTAAAFYYGPPQFTFPITFKALLEKK
ncbi:GDSL esterase/lipase [Hordeum vulgare]|nr:GDSL esterase/lipase [Hordeum vulgare]